jgi:glycosyltransferase involved in cell wall biosynthesis
MTAGPTSSVIVTHPHATPVATGLSRGLEAAGRLAAYFTGVGGVKGTIKGRVLESAGARWPAAANRLHEPDLRGRLRSHSVVETAARALGLVVPRFSARIRSYDLIYALHDLAVALARWPPKAAAIYAYEDGASSTFARAARSGMSCIWDLPTPHHVYLASMRSEEGRRWPELASANVAEPEWKIARKSRELELSSAVAVASRFTASSLPETLGTRPVLVVPYGFPLDAFPPKEMPNDGPLLVVAVGSQSAPKGTHYLLEAWKRAGLKDARLRLIGPMRLPERFVAGYRGLFEHVPHVPRAWIGSEYRAADLLAFPTLGDGFGLVIQEAMCSGTPVLTTPCGGGPECLTDGAEGWIIPPREVDALVDRLRFAAANRDALVRMGAAARRRAETWSWREAAGLLVAGLTRHGLL